MGKQRTVLITGGTKGLGLATAEAFAAEGAKLLLTYRSDEENARRVEDDFRKRGVDCHLFAIDFTDPTAADSLFRAISAVTDEVLVYVHNAAATAFKPLLDAKPHHLHKTFQMTVFSFVENAQRLVPLMKGGGVIVSVSGMDTLEAVPFHGILAAAKSSLEMLTKYLGHELAPLKIRVNGVNPGYIPTESTQKYLGPAFDAVNKMIGQVTPMRSLADPKDIASVIVFLASEGARWMVGQTLVVDGGWTFASPGFSFLKGSKE